MNNEILMQVLDEQSKAYELAVMSALTECEKGWRKNSGFPFLHIATYDYYVQKYMEPRLETFIRTYLFNQVLDKLFSHCGFETKPVRIPEGCDFLTNEELEKRLEFELIISKANHTIGLRYTDFEDCYNPGINAHVR